MKLLIVTPLLPPESGGPSYLSVALAEELQNKGNEVDLLAFREVRKYPTIIRHILFFFKVLKQSKTKDALIILDTVSVALPAVYAGRLRSKKMIVRVGGDFMWEQYVERTKAKILLSEFYKEDRELSIKERLLLWLQREVVLKHAHAVVFNTDWFRNIWLTPYAIPKEKTVVIEHAHEKREKTHVGGESFLCAWRPTAFKNIDTLELAYTLAVQENLKIKVETLKDIPREELFDRMRYARALIIPSLTETSSIMAREALEIGLPVMITKDCGSYDLLDGHVTWINPLSADNIAGKMVTLMDEKEYERAQEMTNSFDYEHTYSQIADEYLALLT